MANILIFEDNFTLATSWQEVLEAYGHQVEYTTNLEAAMEKIYAGSVDIALIDIFIQQDNRLIPQGGLMLISKIYMLGLAQKPWLIAVSGRSHDSSLSVLEVAKSVGADEYLQKPIDLQELLSVVDRVIVSQSS
ncbi:response regulator (plasmid) [Acaryochloris sp. 'Moss Beach']|uniref:response regulator n=1 Tax=Acaryochloris sp. 'Moss Beach' TaxID=2740837 RepID=UPI001F1D1BE6|nr:response regulator [Acaryochloris sp. 'Moss Beach']UJB72390.1 response regulator [Acaryochloris sp. 'Moss Beach']